MFRALACAVLAAVVWVGLFTPGPALEDAHRTTTVDARPATGTP